MLVGWETRRVLAFFHFATQQTRKNSDTEFDLFLVWTETDTKRRVILEQVIY